LLNTAGCSASTRRVVIVHHLAVAHNFTRHLKPVRSRVPPQKGSRRRHEMPGSRASSGPWHGHWCTIRGGEVQSGPIARTPGPHHESPGYQFLQKSLNRFGANAFGPPRQFSRTSRSPATDRHRSLAEAPACSGLAKQNTTKSLSSRYIEYICGAGP
jgi:hypothetical protein